MCACCGYVTVRHQSASVRWLRLLLPGSCAQTAPNRCRRGAALRRVCGRSGAACVGVISEFYRHCGTPGGRRGRRGGYSVNHRLCSTFLGGSRTDGADRLSMGYTSLYNYILISFCHETPGSWSIAAAKLRVLAPGASCCVFQNKSLTTVFLFCSVIVQSFCLLWNS